ncbi:MAG: PQQ-dependent sugar dehydrogenase, partial [Candidatus Hydrogenedentes bacterium]|nr:PQQ-dependent sugar dehydrogenase [Candidatus Hydrogenedentota bacterium]
MERSSRLSAVCLSAFFMCLVPFAHAQSLTVEPVASGLIQPTFLGSGPGDPDRLYVLERTTGKVKLIKNGVVAAKPFLNLGSKINSDVSERGLLGFAIHPDYPAKRLAYVNYTNLNGDNVIERYRIRKNRDRANRNSAKPILTIEQPTDIHNGGMLAFGPLDKYLYISSGDGGPANDTDENAQDLGAILGKILRIDVNTGKALPYRIPSTNPFVGTPGARGEIWAYGLRNPWRFTFDRLTGDLYIGDVGQGAR